MFSVSRTFILFSSAASCVNTTSKCIGRQTRRSKYQIRQVAPVDTIRPVALTFPFEASFYVFQQ